MWIKKEAQLFSVIFLGINLGNMVLLVLIKVY